ncbi:hypothetical protein KAR91_56100 [Candidatus Pacearchaeota archaeon]|nr:hypothetical protein [Candidatus Pacearchaeota archaeon]
MRKFYIVSALQKNKYELYAAEAEHGILVIDEIIKYSGGVKTALNLMVSQSKRIIENITQYQKEGIICLVEEIVPEYGKYAVNRSLNDPVDGRSGRDVYFERFIALNDSGKLVIPTKNKTAVPSSKSYETKVNDSGKITYLHRSGDIKGELRTILLLVSAYMHQPMTTQWLQQYHDAVFKEKPKLTDSSRIAKALTTDAEWNRQIAYERKLDPVKADLLVKLAGLYEKHDPVWVATNMSKFFTEKEIEILG